MSVAVYANGMSIACKVASGKTTAAFPDTCLSPPSPPIPPIPYPNTASASDTTDGSKTVQIGGEEVMLKDKSTFKTSTGNEAATKSFGMGVVTHQITGKAAFIAWSMDVKFEGENIPRHMDLMGHNEGSDPPNTPPWPYVDGMTTPSVNKKPCNASCPRKPSKAQYKKVRANTPSDEVRAAVNSKTPLVCTACGTPSAGLAADHIVPLKIISQMPGFACLSEENQIKVANAPSNFAGLCTPCNSSKGAKTWHRWKGIKNIQAEWAPWVREPARAKTNEQMKVLKSTVKGMPCG